VNREPDKELPVVMREPISAVGDDISVIKVR
jgi:hypothetical protein